MTLRAVLFDLDGTLVDSAPAIAAALSCVRGERGGGAIGADEVRPWISLGAPELMRLALGDLAGEPGERLAAFRAALAVLPTPSGSLYPGVRELLSRLGEAGLKLAVVTNKPQALARKLLEDLALAAAFGEVAGGDSTSHAKPHPALLTHALARLGVLPSEVAMVGDSEIDAEAAAALGLPFHLFLGGYGASGCEHWPAASRFGDHAALLDILLPPGRAAA